MKDTAAWVGGCQSGKESIIYLSSIFLTRVPLSLFPPFPSFHASVLLFLAPRGSVAKANKQRRLFISASGGKQRNINLVLTCLGLPQPPNSLRKTDYNDFLFSECV